MRNIFGELKKKEISEDTWKKKSEKTLKANEKLVNQQIVEKSATHHERWIWRYRVSIRSRSSYWLVIRRDRETSGCSCNQNSCAAARHHRPRVSADYDSSTREHRERVKRGEGEEGDARRMRPPDQCSGGSGYDARRSRRGASRRDAGESGKARRAKRGCAKRSPLPVCLRGIPTRVAPFPGTIACVATPVALCATPVSSPGSETPTYDRWTLRVWAGPTRERERQRARRISRRRELTGTTRTCDSSPRVSCFYFNLNLGNALATRCNTFAFYRSIV